MWALFVLYEVISRYNQLIGLPCCGTTLCLSISPQDFQKTLYEKEYACNSSHAAV
jgi:hypothetical protein